jgi:BASS family bile acid:Na+ symporter
MNYLVLAGFILVMSMIIIREADLWTGFVILAGVPPAVAVMPFADFLKGSRTYALMGTVGAYLGALIIMPLMSFMLLGPGFYDPGKLLMIMAELIIAPLILSRILLRYGMDKRLASTKGTITNWSFFVLVYTIVGLNQDVLVNNPLKLVPIMAIAIGSTFFLGWFIERVGAFFRLDRETPTSIVLLGTLKNYGLAGGIALALFGKQTAIPATVSTVFMIVYIIWLSFKKQRENL